MTAATIQLESEGGGSGQDLLAELIAPRLGAVAPAGRLADSAVLDLDAKRIALATDSFVIDPIFFGNGDIGRLAVCGTVNDLAVNGAVPRYLTLSLVLEQGLPVVDLERVLDSIRAAAEEACVEVVAGDAKVVRSGEVDKLYINTAGVGELAAEVELGSDRVRRGDAVIVTSWLGNHGTHILSLRAGLGHEKRVLSDCAPLDGLVWNVLEDYACEVHCMRDITRGGLGTVLNELAAEAGVAIEIEAHHLPIQRTTRTAAEALGVDPLHLASEGAICMVVDGEAAAEILELLHWQPQGQAAQIVGCVQEDRAGAVTMVRPDGAERSVEMFSGPRLPRLC
jgi:hydrogenase expression/formation protein HypE